MEKLLLTSNYAGSFVPVPSSRGNCVVGMSKRDVVHVQPRKRINDSPSGGSRNSGQQTPCGSSRFSMDSSSMTHRWKAPLARKTTFSARVELLS
ncbi:hypothetical protein KM043_015318 [Ampulex compressa]|nr:hypothetical protein KM043_015318 [Ampulex compressa]